MISGIMPTDDPLDSELKGGLLFDTAKLNILACKLGDKNKTRQKKQVLFNRRIFIISRLTPHNYLLLKRFYLNASSF